MRKTLTASKYLAYHLMGKIRSLRLKRLSAPKSQNPVNWESDPVSTGERWSAQRALTML
ncbi:hypothetical protein BH10PSE6_BH10PSE6_42150 [soil metagenome]